MTVVAALVLMGTTATTKAASLLRASNVSVNQTTTRQWSCFEACE